MAHLTLRYLDWLALQLLPDTAETEWLDRHGDIWLVNADGSVGRKVASLASGSAEIYGTEGVVIPAATQLSNGAVLFETLEEVTIGSVSVLVNIRAIEPGIVGNLEPGTYLEFVASISGADNALVATLSGGANEETDNQLRQRILQRIQNPPMGGAQADYVTWALSIPGVTRAWAAPEQGPGTMTVRFLMDDLRADDNGWPQPADVQMVDEYIDTVRPVTVKDCYVLPPIKQFIDIEIADLVPSTAEVAGAIEQSILDMLFTAAAPGVTIHAAWVSFAIMNTPGVQSFHLVTTDDYVMPSLGHMAVLGTILYDEPPVA